MPNHYILTPAYGRDYKSKAQVMEDYHNEKDFVHETNIHFGGGTYINRQQVEPGATVTIRYSQKRKLISFKQEKEIEKETRKGKAKKDV